MRFALVGPTLEENLALGYLAAALRAARHAATVVPFAGAERAAETARRALEPQPDVVGLSLAFQVGSPALLAVADALRARGFRGLVVAGGPFASLAADELLRATPALDAVLCGEADESIVRLADALRDGTPLPVVPGLVLRDGDALRRGPRPVRPADLDRLPFPARDTPAPSCAGVPAASLVASRGCRGRCSFCSLAACGALADGPLRRERSVGNVVRELVALHRATGARFFVFQDDDFLGAAPAARLARAVELRRALDAARLPPVAFALKARPDGIDAATLAELRRAGLAQLFLGVETVARAGLEAFARGVTPDRVREALATLREAGVFVASNLLLWRPDGTLAELRENLALLTDFPDQLFNFGRAEPYEGAPLTRQLAREGRLRGDWRRRDYELAEPAARRSFALFAATLAARCGESGAIPLAQRVGTAAAVAARLHDPRRTAPLVARAHAALGRLAASNRRLLARIAELADDGTTATAGVVEQLRADRADHDAALVPALRELLARFADCAAPEPGRRARRSAWSVPARAAAVAAAGALACAQPQPPVAHPVGPDLGEPAGAPDADVPGLEVELQTAQRFVGGGPCDPPTEQPSVVAVAARAAPPAVAIERVEVEGGVLETVAVAPDGSRAVASLLAGRDLGQGRLVLHVRRADGSAAVQTEPFWWAGGYAFATEEERTRHLEPDAPYGYGYGMGCDPPGPLPTMLFEPREIFAQQGRVAAAMWGGRPEGWATTIGFAVGVTDAAGADVEPLEATCEIGRLTVERLVSDGQTFPPGWFVGRFTPFDAEGRAALPEGSFACTVAFRVREPDGTAETVSLRLGLTVAADGTVSLGASSSP